MSVPNFSVQVRKLYDTGLFNLKTEEGQGAFTDAVVAMLHGIDERFGHLRKKPGQSQLHGHGEDSALYLSDDPGQSQAVDFIGGAGGANPQPGWIVDAPRYSASDWLDPFDHGLEAPPAPQPSPIPSYDALGGDRFYREAVGAPLQADYVLAGQQLNDGAAVWFSRTIYDQFAALIGAHGAPVDNKAILLKHRTQWRAALGLPPL